VRLSLAAAFLALTAAPAGVAVAQTGTPSTAPAPTDWTTRIERTAEGGHRMGNPQAPVKLVEYASIGCSHCADFNSAAGEALRERHVRSGRVSWEVRPYIISPGDPGMFLLLQCQAPEHFFATSDRLFATQQAWQARIDAAMPQLRTLPDVLSQMRGVTRASGVDQLFKERGMSEAQIAACLADEAGLERIVEAQEAAMEMGVEGTPTFFINGRMLPPVDWAQLEPMLAAEPAAGGGGTPGE